jgi:hypothetical protein
MSAHEETWEGGYRRYDLVKEFVIALVVVTLLSLALAFVFSSPDEQPVTFRAWSQADAKDFVATAVTELNGSSEVAQYGPPYTNTPDAAQKIGPISLQAIPGVRIPIDTAQAFVIGPLQTEANDEAVATALEEYLAASPIQRAAWTDAYAAGLDTATISEGKIAMPAGSGDAGPVAVMMQEELRLAQSGGLDGALLTTKQFYQTDYTKWADTFNGIVNNWARSITAWNLVLDEKGKLTFLYEMGSGRSSKSFGIQVAELASAGGFALVSSVRGWRPAVLVP